MRGRYARYRRGLTALVTLTGVMVFAGCGSSGPPTWPEPDPGVFLVYGVVLDKDGACLKDATVTIVGGPRDGEVFKQETPCGTGEDDKHGFVVRGLSLGEVVMLRASAPDHISEDVVWQVRGPQTALLEFRLVKAF